MRKAGAKALGFLCHAFPEAVAAGLGLIPLRLHCGASASAESSGEKHVRADVCPLVKSTLGNVAMKEGLHAEVDLWAGLLTCDQMRRAMFMLAEDFGLEMHPFQLPATRTDASAEYYTEQIQRFVSDVEALHGLHFDVERALDWHEERRKAARVLIRCARSMAISPLGLHAMFHMFFTAQPHGLSVFLEELVDSADNFISVQRRASCSLAGRSRMRTQISLRHFRGG
jgi:benzoyl-CoA reductase/2-hydroxyglutaryl-CoA dehydratase subunit BcrC/BadD/HgdB